MYMDKQPQGQQAAPPVFQPQVHAHRNTVQITRMMALKGWGGGEELQDINIYVHVRSLEVFVIESSLPVNEAIFCSPGSVLLPNIYSVLCVHLPSFGR